MKTLTSRAVTLSSCLLASLALAGWSPRTDSTAGFSLLATAIHDTDTVKTLQYSDQFVEHFSNGTLTTLVQGQEDEARNREQDRQTVVERVKNSKGKTVTGAYAVNVVFLNGETYYQHPLMKDKTWRTRKGMSFNDGIAVFKRGRTIVKYDKPFAGVHLAPAGTAANGETRFQGRVTKGGLTGTIDVFVSKGTMPYVAAVTEAYTEKIKGKIVKVQGRMLYGPFNRALNITAPVTST